MESYVFWFTWAYKWPPSELERCRMGHLDLLWRTGLCDKAEEALNGSD